MSDRQGKELLKKRLEDAADAAQALAAMCGIAGEPVTAGALILLSLTLRRASKKL